MNSAKAKAIALKATYRRMGDAAQFVTDFLLHPSWEVCQACGGTGTNPGFDVQDFIRHLERASQVVLDWPGWKQNVLGSVGV